MTDRDVTLLILLPTPGHVVTEFMMSMIGLTQELRARRIRFQVKTYAFSDIVMSRNYLMSLFQSRKIFTHALWLDSDIEFAPEQVFRLLDQQVDFAVAPYPSRRMSPDAFYRAVVENEGLPESERGDAHAVFARSLSYVLNQTAFSADWTRKQNGDFATVPSCGMGFSLMRRNVPETLVARRIARDMSVHGRLPIYRDAPEFHDYFSHVTPPGGNRMFGEDQSFCYRWVAEAGGDIWMDTKARLTHHGSYGFAGQFPT